MEILENKKKIFYDYNQVAAHVYNQKAYYLAESNKKKQAIESIQKAISLLPDSSDYYDSYGDILLMFGNYEKAKELEFTPIETYIKLGRCYMELGQHEKALENLEIGKYKAIHSVKKMVFTKDDKRIEQPDPQTELIKEADKYISEIKKYE